MKRAASALVLALALGPVAPVGVPVAPVAWAAEAPTMADRFDPYFDITPQVVGPVGGHMFSTIAEFPIKGVPEGTRWNLIEGRGLSGKQVLVQQHGDILTAQLYSTAAPLTRGAVHTDFIDLRVHYPDGSTETATVYPKLIPTDSLIYAPEYGIGVTTDPGKRFSITPSNGLPGELPDDAKWTLLDNANEWDVTVDPKTGVISGTVPKDTRFGAYFRVKAEFPDGTERIAQAWVNNTGIGAVDRPVPESDPKPEPAPQPAPEPEAGSTPLQTLALVFGILAVLGGAAAFAWPHLQGMLPF